jgi:hypothetical protein
MRQKTIVAKFHERKWNEIWRRVNNISADRKTHCSQIFIKCVYCSLAVDESTEITPTAQTCIYARRDIPFWSVWRICGSPFITRETKGLDFIQTLLRSILRHELWTQLPMFSLSHLFCKWHGVSLHACPRSPEWSDMVPSNYPKRNMEMRISGLATHMDDASAADVIRPQITRRSLVESKVN